MNCTFCDFIAGKRKIHDNYPFIPINDAKNTISFLSTDFPAKQDGHILIISKKHFKNLDDVPKGILHELIDHVLFASKVIRKRHEGCNILLNNGKNAGQAIKHVHFHVIPRDADDGIKIESWKRRKVSIPEFKKVSLKFKKDFNKFTSIK